MIADKHLFIITSALKPGIGVISHEDRLKQTLDTLQNVRTKVPDSIILFVDCSLSPINDIYGEIEKYSDINLDMGACESNALVMSKHGLKSQAEICMLSDTLTTIKQSPEIRKLLPSIKRIHKLSARSELLDNFDITKYDSDEYYGKYIFKKRIPSWMPREIIESTGADHLLITRMFSLCTSLIDDYNQTLEQIFNNVSGMNIDTEHAHFLNIDKTKLVEWDNLNFKGIMAGNGSVEIY